MVPLFVSYRTKTGNSYVYDVCSGEILRVSDVVDRVLEDYHVLTPDEICEKHLAPGKESVREAMAQLDEAQERGLLCDHAPGSLRRWRLSAAKRNLSLLPLFYGTAAVF